MGETFHLKFSSSVQNDQKSPLPFLPSLKRFLCFSIASLQIQEKQKKTVAGCSELRLSLKSNNKLAGEKMTFGRRRLTASRLAATNATFCLAKYNVDAVISLTADADVVARTSWKRTPGAAAGTAAGNRKQVSRNFQQQQQKKNLQGFAAPIKL